MGSIGTRILSLVSGKQAFYGRVVHAEISPGLGSPPNAFYTDDVESANRIIKRETNYEVCEWPEFCRLAKMSKKMK